MEQVALKQFLFLRSHIHTFVAILDLFSVFVAQNIFFFNSIDSNYEERQFEYCIMGNNF